MTNDDNPVAPGAIDTTINAPIENDPATMKALLAWRASSKSTNTVPGQFSEWLHGETLVNQGMMLSPWFPPRYL